VELLRNFLRQVEDLGLLGRIFILVGVGPLRSAKAAEWMRKHVPGLHIPDAVIKRMAGAQDGAREGRQVCIDLIQEIHSLRGISGIHLMAYKQEDSIPEIVDRSGVLRGRVPWYPGRDPETNTNRTLS
jgi:methylenetetrahydrofolate reductase (NADPH)